MPDNDNNVRDADTIPFSSDPSVEEAASEANMDSPRTFTCFEKLVPELRLNIWKFACFIPRIVWIQEDENLMDEIDLTARALAQGTDRVAYHSNPDPPAVLQVCQEFEDESTQTLLVGVRYTFTIPPVWVNWEVDTIAMTSVRWEEDERYIRDLKKLFDAKRLKSLALNVPYGDTNAISMIPTEGHLQELILFSCDDAMLMDVKTVDVVDIKHGE